MLKNRNLVIAVVAIIVILGAGIGFLAISKDDTATNTQSGGNNNQQSSTNTSSKGSLSSLATGKKAQECTMNYSGASGSGTGTMYSDGNGRARMHIDLKTEKGNAGQSDQIMKEGKAYSWTTSEGQTFGMIMDMSKTTQQTQTQNGATSSAPQPNQDFDISCKDWKVDESKFAVPTNVNFMDMNNLQNSIPTGQ